MVNRGLSRVVWRASLPLLFVEATETLDHLIDSVFLARVGETELGAIAIADAVAMLFLVLPLALVDAVQIVTARRFGQRRHAAVGAVFDQGLLLVLGLCALATLGLKVASPFLAEWLVESEAVGEAVDDYLQLDAYSFCFAGASFAFGALLTSIAQTRVLVPATAILVVVDVVLNYAFIFGELGCPELGMRGAAVGSIGAEGAVALFLGLHVWRRLGRGPLRVLAFRGREPRSRRLLARIATPLAAQGLLEDLRWFLFFVLIEHVGTASLAAANIVYTCYTVLWIPAEGFSEIALSMVGRYVGRERAHRIGRLLRSATGGAMAVTAPALIVAVLAPHWLVAMFAPATELVPDACASLRVVALGMIVVVPGHIWATAVTGTGDTLAALGIELLLSVTMLGLACAAVLLGWPLAAIWLALPSGWLVCLAAAHAWLRRGLWRRLEV